MYYQSQKNDINIEETLIVVVGRLKGGYVARTSHCACKRLVFDNDSHGFHQLTTWITENMKVNRKDQVVLGIADMNLQWMKLAYYAKSKGFSPLIVSPDAGEFHDLFNNKNAYGIMQRIKSGHYTTANLPEGIYAELQKGSNVRNDLLSKLHDTREEINRWIDCYFPEFMTVFNGWEGNNAIHILTYFPFPEEIRGITTDKIALICNLSVETAELLQKAAQRSIGINHGSRMAEVEIITLLNQYHVLQDQKNQVNVYLENFCTSLREIKTKTKK
ncbi:hypothetical protein EPH95_06295 [Salicibibacter halophilus]|uniref:Uncharacterized protein n=1 Tax=Salicibibacter halophilus TaxID=2502791 RepID=A0A514LG43_9BACI|nr:hypothetical protein [Salicibibacter halophilus]QDI90832.1 hypothetical protein EPH95_06295 [Salicibibacter halophilus]